MSAVASPPPLEDQVAALVEGTLVPLLRVHGGGVELVAVEGGRVRLRFVDACTACRLRPLTMAAAIRPRLLELEGVEEVELEGVRISAAALERFERLGGRRYAALERQRTQATKAREE
jgi:Fe-S cluster biogenesis protein NfuA